MTGATLAGRAGGPTDLSRDASQPEALIPSAFTLGPWEWAYFGEEYGYCLVGASPSHSSVRQNVTIAHDTADGKLAAAAPELLAALAEAGSFLRRLGWHEDADKAAAAISKAISK